MQMEHAPSQSTRISTHEMAKMAICVAFLCVSAQLSFPLPFTPGMVTGLTLALGVAAFVLTPKQTFLVVTVYILLGAAGLPVFAGASGIGRLLGPAGGFYFAWLVAYPLVSKFKGSSFHFRRYALANIILGMPVTYVGGVSSMMLLMDVNLWQAMTMAVFPFIPGDILKALGAAFLGVRINQALASRFN